MKIICILGFHKWNKWEYIKPIGRYETRLKRTCNRCGKVEKYDGLIERDINTNDPSPYKNQ